MMDALITMPLLSLPNHDARASSSATTPVPPKKGEPSNPKRDREKCEEMEKQSNKAKALCQPELKDCKRQDDQGRPICWAYILKKKRRLQGASGRWTVQEGAHICIRCKISSRDLATCRVNS